MHISSLMKGIELDEPAQEQVRGIEQELDTSMRFFREELMSDMKRINQDIDAKLIALLNEEQKTRFMENKRKWEERIRSGFGRRGPSKSGRHDRGGHNGMGGDRSRNDLEDLRDWRTKADVNNDGELTEEESAAFWDKYWESRGGRPAPSRGDWYWILRNFAEIDVDTDGSLSEEECRQAKDKHSSRPPSRFGGGRRGPDGGPPPHLRGERAGFAPRPSSANPPSEEATAPKQ